MRCRVNHLTIDDKWANLEIIAHSALRRVMHMHNLHRHLRDAGLPKTAHL
jgi:hypothetical protein